MPTKTCKRVPLLLQLLFSSTVYVSKKINSKAQFPRRGMVLSEKRIRTLMMKALGWTILGREEGCLKCTVSETKERKELTAEVKRMDQAANNQEMRQRYYRKRASLKQEAHSQWRVSLQLRKRATRVASQATKPKTALVSHRKQTRQVSSFKENSNCSHRTTTLRSRLSWLTKLTTNHNNSSLIMPISSDGRTIRNPGQRQKPAIARPSRTRMKKETTICWNWRITLSRINTESSNTLLESL